MVTFHKKKKLIKTRYIIHYCFPHGCLSVLRFSSIIRCPWYLRTTYIYLICLAYSHIVNNKKKYIFLAIYLHCSVTLYHHEYCIWLFYYVNQNFLIWKYYKHMFFIFTALPPMTIQYLKKITLIAKTRLRTLVLNDSS